MEVYIEERPDDLDILGEYISDFIKDYGKAILHHKIFLLEPYGECTLDQQMLIRKILNDKDHPWMKPWYRKVAEISIGVYYGAGWRQNASPHEPEDKKKIEYELEILGTYYDDARYRVDMLGEEVFEYKGLINHLNSDQVALLQKIVRDESHQWMLDHAANKGSYIEY